MRRALHLIKSGACNRHQTLFAMTSRMPTTNHISVITPTITRASNKKQTTFVSVRHYSAPSEKLTKEQLIKNVLTDKFAPILLNVQDVSGGCGSMFNVLIVSDGFKGQTPVKRHRAVHEVLKEDIKEMHGISLLLKTEDEYNEMLKKARS